MKELNKLRLLSGIPIDGKIEVTEKEELTEARTVPSRKKELKPKDFKSMSSSVSCIKTAIKHIENACKVLEKAPSTDFVGNIPSYINELEDLLNDKSSGMKSHLSKCESELKKVTPKDLKESEESSENEEENTSALDMPDTLEENENNRASEIKKEIHNLQVGLKDETPRQHPSDKSTLDQYDRHDQKMSGYKQKIQQLEKELKTLKEDNIDEATHLFSNMSDNFEEDKTKPVNVSDGSSNSEQIYKVIDSEETDDENPSQLRTGDEQSDQDQSSGLDVETKFKVPAAIMKSLQTAIDDAKAEAKKMGSTNKDSASFFNDLSNAFDDLKGHLSKGTLYDFKLGQSFAQTLMGPMVHKLPADVWKFLTNGGTTRSLKDYMKPVKDPITGPRNTIK